MAPLYSSPYFLNPFTTVGVATYRFQDLVDGEENKQENKEEFDNNKQNITWEQMMYGVNYGN